MNHHQLALGSFLLCVSVTALSSCERDDTKIESQSAPATPEAKPMDAGTGNADARGVQTGSGTRSDYKPTTGPGSHEDTRKNK